MNDFSALILDLDGVLITTPPWKPDTTEQDGYSSFNPDAVKNLNSLLLLFDFNIWLSSNRRKTQSIEVFNTIFANRGILQKITGFLPVDYQPSSRKDEITLFINTELPEKFLIIDDDKSLLGAEKSLKDRLVITDYLKGFDKEKLQEAILKMENII